MLMQFRLKSNSPSICNRKCLLVGVSDPSVSCADHTNVAFLNPMSLFCALSSLGERASSGLSCLLLLVKRSRSSVSFKKLVKRSRDTFAILKLGEPRISRRIMTLPTLDYHPSLPRNLGDLVSQNVEDGYARENLGS